MPKSTTRSKPTGLPIIHPFAAGIDIGSRQAVHPVLGNICRRNAYGVVLRAVCADTGSQRGVSGREGMDSGRKRARAQGRRQLVRWFCVGAMGVATGMAGAGGNSVLPLAKPVTVYTDFDEHSLIYDAAGKPVGCTLDVVKALVKRAGDGAPLQVLPWSRAHHIVLTEANTALFPVTRTPERESMFAWVGPLGGEIAAFYRRRGGQPKVADLAAAKRLAHIAVPRAWYQQQLLEAEGFRNLVVLTTQEQAVRMLLSGRVDVVAADNMTLPGTLQEIGRTMDEVEVAYEFWRGNTYLAFSAQTPPPQVARWQAALDDMRNEGVLARMSAQWQRGGMKPCGLAGAGAKR